MTHLVSDRIKEVEMRNVSVYPVLRDKLDVVGQLNRKFTFIQRNTFASSDPEFILTTLNKVKTNLSRSPEN